MIPVIFTDGVVDSFLLTGWGLAVLRGRRVCAICQFILIVLRGGRDKCNSNRGPLIFGDWSSSVKSANMETAPRRNN